MLEVEKAKKNKKKKRWLEWNETVLPFHPSQHRPLFSSCVSSMCDLFCFTHPSCFSPSLVLSPEGPLLPHTRLKTLKKEDRAGRRWRQKTPQLLWGADGLRIKGGKIKSQGPARKSIKIVSHLNSGLLRFLVTR